MSRPYISVSASCFAASFLAILALLPERRGLGRLAEQERWG